MKILIADKVEAAGLAALTELGHEVVSRPALTGDDLPAAVEEIDPELIVVRSTVVNAAAIRAGKRLKLVIRAGAGYDTIDVDTASSEGVSVANCPGKNAIAVAELAWALILACDRQIPDQTIELRAGTWNKKRFGSARGLAGRTLGVIGLGPIGRAVVERGKAFDMQVVAWSRSLDAARAAELGVELAASPLDVARRADVVSLHVASNADTRHLVDQAFIAAMKPGATLVNTTRGAVVDEAALRDGIVDKGLRAGLDVFDGEPKVASGSFECALAALPGVYCTHHIGASTDQAQLATTLEAVHVADHFAGTGEVLHCVNRARRSPATCLMTVRHRNRPGVLARVFEILSAAHINVEEMDNTLFEGAQAACARIQLDSAPSAADLGRIRSACAEILSVDLSSIAS
jgi:D-3-phosphoglycerate dehydrogenase